MVGQTISHYRVLRELGGGGMGLLYVAEDLRLGRRVAVKFIRGTSSKQALDRLKREAKALSTLNHPNICTIYEIEENEGRPFIVMELLEGESLKERLQRKPLAFEELLEIALQAADAIEAAHAKGIIHRGWCRELGPSHCSFVYSALASFRMGMSGSASFQSVKSVNTIVSFSVRGLV